MEASLFTGLRQLYSLWKSRNKRDVDPRPLKFHFELHLVLFQRGDSFLQFNTVRFHVYCWYDPCHGSQPLFYNLGYGI
jgi:hypothetical protein